MALCTLNGGYSAETCSPSNGGTKVLGMMPHDKSADYHIADDTNPVEGQVVAHNATAASTLEKFEQEMETAVVTETMAADRKTNTRTYSSSIQITIPYVGNETENTAIDAIVEEVTKGNLVISVTDNSGVTRLYGGENGLRATTSEVGPGTAFEDLNGIVITFTGKESKKAPVLVFGGNSSSTIYSYS